MKEKTLIVACILSVFTACRKAEEPADEGKAQWKTVVVKRGDTEVSQLYSATIQGRQDIEIRPQVEGRISELCVKEGQKVRRGQTLFVIDPVPYQAALEQATAQVKAAQAALSTARLNYNGTKRLYDEQVVSEHELNVTRNTLLDAEAGLSLALATQKNARNNLSYTSVTSPTDGVVGVLPFREGALVGPDISRPLTTISDNSEMYVYFSIDENRLLSMLRRYGSTDKAIAGTDSVVLFLSDGGAYSHKGRISSISGVINSSTGSVSLRADFPNPDRLLHSGATGNVQLVSKYHDVMLIPQSATMSLQDKTIVYKVVDGKAVATPITTNPGNNGRQYIVESGLDVGDVIIAEGVGLVNSDQL